MMASLLLVLSFLSAPAAATGSAASLPPGFQLVPDPAPASGKDRFEVVEFFWYSCPHCNRFEPKLTEWLINLPGNVSFTRVPAVVRNSWTTDAKTYYTAEALGVLHQVHPRIFSAIHEKDRALDNETDLEQFFSEQGVDRAQFKQAYHSPEVSRKVHDAMLLTRRLGVAGVPAIVVNDRYRTDSESAGGLDQMLEALDKLIGRKPDTSTSP
jgi:thiol:disulfide interchange protein DsbA